MKCTLVLPQDQDMEVRPLLDILSLLSRYSIPVNKVGNLCVCVRVRTFLSIRERSFKLLGSQLITFIIYFKNFLMFYLLFFLACFICPLYRCISSHLSQILYFNILCPLDDQFVSIIYNYVSTLPNRFRRFKIVIMSTLRLGTGVLDENARGIFYQMQWNRLVCKGRRVKGDVSSGESTWCSV